MYLYCNIDDPCSFPELRPLRPRPFIFSRCRRSRRRPPLRHPLRHVRRLPDEEEGRGVVRPRRAQTVAHRQLLLEAAEPGVLRVDGGPTTPIPPGAGCGVIQSVAKLTLGGSDM